MGLWASLPGSGASREQSLGPAHPRYLRWAWRTAGWRGREHTPVQKDASGWLSWSRYGQGGRAGHHGHHEDSDPTSPPAGSCLARDQGSSTSHRLRVRWHPMELWVQKHNALVLLPSSFLPCLLSPALTRAKLPQNLALDPSQAPWASEALPSALQAREVSAGRWGSPASPEIFLLVSSFLRVTRVLHAPCRRGTFMHTRAHAQSCTHVHTRTCMHTPDHVHILMWKHACATLTRTHS